MNFKFYFLKLIFVTCFRIDRSIAIPLERTERNISLSNFENGIYKYKIMQLSKSAGMRNWMNSAVDPCEDFYEFACGSWSRNKPARHVPTTGFFEDLNASFLLKVNRMLNEKYNENDTEIDKALKRFYKSCLLLRDVPPIEHKMELYSIIDQYGSMPILSENDWDENDFDWLKVVAKIQHDFDIEIIIGTDIMADFKNNTINRIYIGQPVLLLDTKSMYLDASNEMYRELYLKKITESMKKNLLIPMELAQKTAREILDFEISLAHGMIDDGVSQSLDESCILTNSEEITKKYNSKIDFKQFLSIVLEENITMPFYEYRPEYQQNLIEIVEKTPKHKIANYIFYKLASHFFPKVSEKAESQKVACNDKLSEYFSKHLDNLFYRRCTNKNTESDVIKIWLEMKNAFRRILHSDKLNWISIETRNAAVKKLDAMKLEINSYMNSNLENEFDDLVIDNMNYISNVKNIMRHKAKKAIAKLHKPPEPYEAPEDLSYTPANIILENIIKIPVSLLQPNYLWDDNYPVSLKFGTLGFLLGHEIVHGFDDSGRDYDEMGNQRNWWDENSVEAFKNRTECFKQQYHNYIFGGRNLPLTDNQAENIADNSGLKIAYDAYLKWLNDTAREENSLTSESLPSMPYSPKQLFFISFAQIWCSDTHPKMEGLQTATDEHMPSRYRVIGVLSNSYDFQKEFSCPKDSGMVSKEPCEIY